MPRQTVSMMMATAAIFGSSMVGCSGASMQHRPALTAQQAPALAPRIEKALASRDYAEALIQAEALVGAMPKDASYRALLGRAYLANGRYASAHTAFSDALTLGNKDVRTIISLALCETGLGDAAGARALLSAHISDLPAADYGLAMAMAGEPQEGVRALLEAVKQPEATAQTRQNLAYALALAGAWGQARLIAGQDLPAREAQQRIGQWSQLVQSGSEQTRVAALVGVAPRADDAGLPTRLALNTAPEPAQMASVDIVDQARQDVAAEVVEPKQPVEMARAEPAPASPDAISVATAFDASGHADAPLIHASSDPMRQAARVAFQRASTTDASALAGRAGMSRIARFTTPASDAEASDWVVQLGAYDSAAIAEEKWARISHGRKGLGEFREIHSEFALNGRTFHRLAVRGFSDRSSAYGLCKSLRAEGQACFVRLDDTDTTRMARTEARKGESEMAERKPGGAGRQVAAR